jgi:hypothetical protein
MWKLFEENIVLPKRENIKISVNSGLTYDCRYEKPCYKDFKMSQLKDLAQTQTEIPLKALEI